MTTKEIAELQRAIGQLRHSVAALRPTYGDAPAVRRLVNDIERLDIDAAELAEPTAPVQPTAREREVVMVSDTPYDPTLWRDADDEGVGGYHRG
jgi:hypothetical protein